MTQTSTSLLNGPSGSFLIRRIRFLRWILNLFEVLEARAKRYGNPFLVAKNASPLAVYFSNPKAIKQILTADPQTFEVGSANDILLPLLGANSLILLDGMKHQRQRKLLMPPFHGDRLRTYGKTICSITKQVISQWHLGEPLPIRTSTQEISLRVIFSTVFGLHQGERCDRLRKLLTTML